MSTSLWPIIQHGVSESPNYVKQKEMKVKRNVDIIQDFCHKNNDNIVVKNMQFWQGSYPHQLIQKAYLWAGDYCYLASFIFFSN